VAYEVLQSLPPAEREQVLAQCPTQRFHPGDAIVHEGEPGEVFYLIESGRVGLRITTPAGEVSTLSVLGAGQAFGEMALIGRRTRTAAAIALEPVTTRAMSRELFDSLRRRHPGLDGVLVDILASRVDRLSRQLAEALYLPVDVRLARRLLALVGVYRDSGAGPVVVPLTQEDIAGIVGATRPTVNQMLQRLVADDIIELGRGRITVVDERGLASRAAGP
jgi:CRP/FNR family transcriptional regulator, cyclic AMP receptor protein